MQDVSDRTSGNRPGAEAEGDIVSIWTAVSEHLAASLPELTYRIWLEPLRPASAQGDVLYLTAPEGNPDLGRAPLRES